jgi:hypothetical protein
VGLNSLKSLNLTNVYPNNKNKKNNKVKSKPLELYGLAGKKSHLGPPEVSLAGEARLEVDEAMDLSNLKSTEFKGLDSRLLSL